MADTYNIGPTVPGLFRAHEDRYQEAQAEIERLREALRKIENARVIFTGGVRPPPAVALENVLVEVREIARATLAAQDAQD